ncbi:hypothetical protein L916_04955 [Phytophthora nicotianae]|uniref:Uncharacterized protein n=2 Tax=Phytophthora nicotianae TaxID=4792 RepID=W2JGA3_PHYNI|nr:hypothetical protein L916_04955 [Phytophthora nicotianae]ETO80243.1 hypothetical protein F444_05181 [Phytophthora nicotianae P1976]
MENSLCRFKARRTCRWCRRHVRRSLKVMTDTDSSSYSSAGSQPQLADESQCCGIKLMAARPPLNAAGCKNWRKLIGLCLLLARYLNWRRKRSTMSFAPIGVNL